MQHVGVQVYIAPVQRQQLPLAPASGERQHRESFQAFSVGKLQERAGMLHGEGPDLHAGWRRPAYCLADVARESALTHGVAESMTQHAVELVYWALERPAASRSA